MIKAYEHDKKIMMELQRKNDVVFNCALTQLMVDGVNNAQKYDLDKISSEIKDDRFVNKDLQITIFTYAKEIATKCAPWSIFTFFKENIKVWGIEEVSDYKTYLGNAITGWREESLYEYADDNDWKNHVCEYIGIDEDEYDEVYGTEE